MVTETFCLGQEALLANPGRGQAGALGTGLWREWVLVALRKGSNRGSQFDTIANHFLRIAPGWDLRLSTSGKGRPRTELFLDFYAVGSGQAGCWLGAGRPGGYLPLLTARHHLLKGIVAGKLFRRRWFRTGAPCLRTDGLIAAGFGFLRGHLGGPFGAGLLLAVFLLTEIRQTAVLVRGGKRTSFSQLADGFHVFGRDSYSRCFTDNFEHLDGLSGFSGNKDNLFQWWAERE